MLRDKSITTYLELMAAIEMYVLRMFTAGGSISFIFDGLLDEEKADTTRARLADTAVKASYCSVTNSAAAALAPTVNVLPLLALDAAIEGLHRLKLTEYGSRLTLLRSFREADAALISEAAIREAAFVLTNDSDLMVSPVNGVVFFDDVAYAGM